VLPGTQEEDRLPNRELIREQIYMTEHENHPYDAEWALKNWRSWGSWFSWGSPVGLGLFIISIGVFLVLLHYAGIIGK